MQFSQQHCLAIPLRDKLPERCELHSVTWVVSNFFAARSVARSRTQLYFSKWIAAAGNTMQYSEWCITSPTAFLAIYDSFKNGACARFSFLFRGALGYVGYVCRSVDGHENKLITRPEELQVVAIAL